MESILSGHQKTMKLDAADPFNRPVGPIALEIPDDYKRLIDEKYPRGTDRPVFDQDLWEKASVVKKYHVKCQGPKRFRMSYTCGSYADSSTQSSSCNTHTPAQCLAAICDDPNLLRQLDASLKRLNHQEFGNVVQEVQQHERELHEQQ